MASLGRYLLILALGIGVGALGMSRVHPSARSSGGTTGPRLKGFVIASGEVLLPEDARVAARGDVDAVSWAPVDTRTRCGVVGRASIRPSRAELPDGVHLCGAYNPFAGGSSDGECPWTTVCVARRGALDMTCESTDTSCPAVVEAFAPVVAQP